MSELEWPCLVEGCSHDRRGGGRGWCKLHYQRWYRRGCLEVQRPSLAERFWRRVEKTDSCWIWRGPRNNRGYGAFSTVHRNPVGAHRMAWELTYGPIPAGMVVRHLVCDNPPCCRPDHLALGVTKDNAEDMVRKGRSLHGERNHQHKLRADQVLAIRRQYAAGEAKQEELAREHGIDQTTVSLIVRGKKWQRVGGGSDGD